MATHPPKMNPSETTEHQKCHPKKSNQFQNAEQNDNSDEKQDQKQTLTEIYTFSVGICSGLWTIKSKLSYRDALSIIIIVCYLSWSFCMHSGRNSLLWVLLLLQPLRSFQFISPFFVCSRKNDRWMLNWWMARVKSLSYIRIDHLFHGFRQLLFNTVCVCVCVPMQSVQIIDNMALGPSVCRSKPIFQMDNLLSAIKQMHAEHPKYVSQIINVREMTIE